MLKRNRVDSAIGSPPNKKAAAVINCRSRFSAQQNCFLCPSHGCKEKTDSRRSSDLCLRRSPVCLLGRYTMTDIHQRQMISTHTAPAAWGVTPLYLVQPVSLYEQPGHGNNYKIIYQPHYSTNRVKVNTKQDRILQLFKGSCHHAFTKASLYWI